MTAADRAAAFRLVIAVVWCVITFLAVWGGLNLAAVALMIVVTAWNGYTAGCALSAWDHEQADR